MKAKILCTILFLTVVVWICGAAVAGPIVEFNEIYGEAVTTAGTWHPGFHTAGVMRLNVNGVSMDAFCIDLNDPATDEPIEYDIIDLAFAPDKSPGPMGQASAQAIMALWEIAYYPNMTTTEAAALQIAIWDCVMDLDYDVSAGGFYITSADPGAQALLDAVEDYTATTSLVALTHDIYQDYVITPEPTMLVLLGIGSLSLRRRRI